MKSRYADEWHAENDRHYALLAERAAELQGCAADAVDWDAVPDRLFQTKPSPLDLAVEALRRHAKVADQETSS